MRPVFYCALVMLVCARWVAAERHMSSELAIVLDFQGPHSTGSTTEMERETEEVLRGSGLHLEWLQPSEAVASSHADLVVMQFKGACVLDPQRIGDREGGTRSTLAFTYETDGVLQPFGEVACDRVAASVLSALQSSDVSRADFLLGRALGRVLAHELVHILTGSDAHAREGIGKAALSGKELITASFPLSPDDLARLRRIYGSSSVAGAPDFKQGGGSAMRLR